MSGRTLSTTAASFAVALVIAGCSSGSDVGDNGQSSTSSTSTSPTVDPADVAAYEACREMMTPFLRKLQNIGSRLNVGLSQSDYSTLLGDARVVYDRSVIAGSDDVDCLKVGVQLEYAYNAYAAANTRWGDCIEGLYCDVDTMALPKMQDKWDRSSQHLEQAQTKLEALDPR